MQRFTVAPRPDWEARVEALGLVWHTAGGLPYWNEAAAYRFTLAEIETLEDASAELYRLLRIAADHVIAEDRLAEFGIPAHARQAVRDSWHRQPPALDYGRFDLGYDGVNPPKLFEFNCDTPTSLVEAAVIQWDWKEAVFPHNDQWNGIHDALVARWQALRPEAPRPLLHLGHVEDSAGEDAVTVAYLADTARAGGIETRLTLMPEIGWDERRRRFVDADGLPIDAIFKLYPWEWIVEEPFAKEILASPDTVWIEPVWKMLWSNKAILAVLWELFPGHPNLLETSWQPLAGDHVVKPILAREGANVRIVERGSVTAERDGQYGGGPFIHQALYRLPGQGSERPVIGSWIVDGEPVGMGIREDGPITGDTARFVPHIIDG